MEDSYGCDYVWGMCYRIREEEKEQVLGYLDYREKNGYERFLVPVMLREEDGTTIERTVIVYTATEQNEHYLGPAPLDEMAKQIAEACGPSGPNCEYLFELGTYQWLPICSFR